MRILFSFSIACSLILYGCVNIPAKIEGSVSDSIDEKFEIPEELADKFTVFERDKKATPVEEMKNFRKRKKSIKEIRRIEKQQVKREAKLEKKGIYSNRRIKNMPFHPGEKIKMDITYFGVTAGTLELKVLPKFKYVGGRKTYHIQGRGVTSSIFALFYKLDDVAETFLDYLGLFSHKFVFRADESKQQRHILELYDYEQMKVHYWQKLDHKKKGYKLTTGTPKKGNSSSYWSTSILIHDKSNNFIIFQSS